MAKKSKTAPQKSTSSGKSFLPFEPTELGDLFDFLKEKGVTEFEWSKGDQKISVKTTYGHAGAFPVIQNYAAAGNVPGSAASGTSAITVESTAKEPDSYKRILSPFVGTFYRAPSPTSVPYCDVGSRVKPGDSLCIIEAMKLMNEIEADFGGTIVQALVENGQTVEFGQALFVIDVAK